MCSGDTEHTVGNLKKKHRLHSAILSGALTPAAILIKPSQITSNTFYLVHHGEKRKRVAKGMHVGSSRMDTQSILHIT